MGDPNIPRFVIDIEVHDVEEFTRCITRCTELSREEPGTLIYDWYIDEEQGRARLYEAYESVDALITHIKGPVFSEAGPDLQKTCTFVHVDAYGDLGRMRDRRQFWPTTFWGPAVVAL